MAATSLRRQPIVYVPVVAHNQRAGLITLYHISNPTMPMLTLPRR